MNLQIKEQNKIENYKNNKKREPATLLNERALRFHDVILIDQDGQNKGVVTSRNALSEAKNLGLDLLVVAPNNQPPICKLCNYGKLKYEEEKRKKQNHKPEHKLKEVKVSPVIAQHDLETMTNRAKEFLRKGHKVKLTCVFKAREVKRPEFGEEKLKLMETALNEVGVTEVVPKLEGKFMSMIMGPRNAA